MIFALSVHRVQASSDARAALQIVEQIYKISEGFRGVHRDEDR